MPEDLLLELEPGARIAGSLESIEEFVREAMRHAVQVGLAIEGMKGLAQSFENTWRRIIMEVTKGRTTEMQAARPRLLSAFEKRLGQLRDTHALATWLRNLGRTEIPDPAVLLPEIAGMEQLKASVFDRWQSADDLEDLAARDYALTTADLDRIGPHRPPPVSFYAEVRKPF